MKNIAEDTKKCLVCLRYGIGDLVSELQVLERLRRRLPAAHITALGARPATELLEDYRCVDAIRTTQDWGITHLGGWVDENRTAEIRRWLADENFDLLLDVSHSAQVIHKAAARLPARVLEMDMAVQASRIAVGGDGITAINESVQAGWGLPMEGDLAPRLCLREEEQEFACRFLDEARQGGSLMIGVSPCASSRLKQWPPERYIGLLDYLAQRYNARILVFTGSNELPTACRLREGLRQPQRVCVLENLHLRKVAALLDRCDLFVGNDSGLMHLAGAVGTPVLAFFGPTSPRIYLPGRVSATALQDPRPCPYRKTDFFGHSRCVLENRCLTDRDCIQQISLDEAIAGADCFLERKECHEPSNSEPTVEPGGVGN